MIIAKEKRRTNVSEYILYMWQIEDILRACKLDFDIVKRKIVDGYKIDIATNHEISEWYKSLIEMMKSEGISNSGHLQMLKNTVMEMNEVHMKLLSSSKEHNYKHAYFTAKSNIDLFRKKSSNIENNDIEICLNALYLLLLMKISKKEISLATMESMNCFSKLLSLLSAKFKDWEEGKIDIL